MNRFCLVLSALLVVSLAWPTLAQVAGPTYLARGNALVTDADGSVFVAFDEVMPGADAADGITDFTFILQRPSEAGELPWLPPELDRALLYFDGKNLLLHGPADGARVLLTISDIERVADLREALPTGRRMVKRQRGLSLAQPSEGAGISTQVVRGIGLIYSSPSNEALEASLGIADSEGRRLMTAASELPCGPDGEGNGSVDCSSGGCGASYCSVDCPLEMKSCGVTCRSGYFACCDCGLDGCTCHDDSECGC